MQMLFQDKPCHDLKVVTKDVQGRLDGSTANIKHSILNIRNFSPEDMGEYKCVATNHGNLTSESRIRITSDGNFWFIIVK